ncbi:hypothetical protein [Pseudomonas sp. RW409]|uniref:hypothetical protein n=1 Tax=Pseudomonas sp. RW409 TaxID=2202895 RepID=UPI000D72AC63|nr:hypothetical protein [Pseudomonas sp. RW409]PWY37979.1 hypothetical protein DK261_24385 [Pseudomonas sp. RW409]
MILPTRAEIVEYAKSGTLLEAIFNDYWGSRYQHCDTLAKELAQAQNDGDIDLLSLLVPDAIDAFHGYKADLGRRVCGLILTKLDVSAPVFLTVLEALYSKNGTEEHEATETLSSWCGASQTRPKELLTLVDVKQVDGGKFYSLQIAIRSGLKVDTSYFAERAYEYITEGTETQKAYVIQALSEPPFNLDADWQRGLSIFNMSVEKETAEQIRSALTRTLLTWLKSAPPQLTNELHLLVSKAAVPTTPAVARDIAYALAFNFKDFESAVTKSLLSILRPINPDPNTLNLIDYGLAHFLKAGEVKLVRDYIAELILHPETKISFENFDSVISMLREGPADRLEEWIIYWLRTAPYKLCQELSDGLFAIKDEYIFQSDFARFDLSELEYGFIARKAIATFFINPAIAASLMVSLGRCAPQPQADVLSDLLFDPLLVNYTSVDKHLQPIADDDQDKAAPMVKKALCKLKDYCDSLSIMGFVPELQPSERERQLEWQRHSDSMNDNMRESRKTSLFANIFSERILLYGNGMVSWIKDDHMEGNENRSSSPGRRMEQKLANFSHQYDIPREEVLDPTGLRMKLFNFKLEGRPE